MLSKIVDLDVVNYINSVQSMCNGTLGELQRYALSKDIPIIDQETAKFLEFLMSIIKPVKILEIGTAVGFSSILMSQFLPEEGSIITIDRAPIMIKSAKENFKKFNVTNKITLIEGDATEILATLSDEFDFIFMDAGKGQYIKILDDCIRLLKKGGVIFADDIFQNGNITKDISEIERRQRTIHRRMNEFVHIMCNNSALQTSIVPIADGVLLSYKK